MWTLTSVWVISTHTSQLHIWSCPSVPMLCYPPMVLWSPSAQDIIDVRQNEEKNKYCWPTKQRGCTLEATIKQHKGPDFIASYWFITKYASSANGLFQLPPPLTAIWLMQLHRWASFGLQRSYNEQKFIWIFRSQSQFVRLAIKKSFASGNNKAKWAIHTPLYVLVHLSFLWEGACHHPSNKYKNRRKEIEPLLEFLK